MRLAILLCILFIVNPLCGFAFTGVVTDDEQGKPLSGVEIYNLSDGSYATSDFTGHFSILAMPGDRLRFVKSGYNNVVIDCQATAAAITVKMKAQNIALKEFVLRSLTPFQRDSLAMHALYQEQLDKKRVKPQFSGLGVNNLITSLAQGLSKKHKQNEAFKAEFAKDEQQKFIDTRYTLALTATLTGLKGDSLVNFKNSHPMDYNFARKATDLELKMWIRDSYKLYMREPAKKVK